MKIHVTKIWINESKEVQADFSNNRHHAVAIDRPYGAGELARALDHLASNIVRDRKLDGT